MPMVTSARMAAPVVGLFPVLRRQKAGLRAASPRSGAAPAPRWVLRRATAAPRMASLRGRAAPATRLALFRRRTSSASPSMRGHATRTTPVMEDKGVKYWKLGSYCNYNISIMRQEFDEENRTKNKDMWFMFTEDEHKVVEDHVTTRSRRLRRNHNWV
ncbi:hypothetical protein ACQJBY_053769 [Aegilops geniculata]